MVIHFCYFKKIISLIILSLIHNSFWGCTTLNPHDFDDNNSSTNVNDNVFSYFQQTSLPYDSTLNSDPLIQIDDDKVSQNNHIFIKEQTSAVNTMLRAKYMENPEYQKLNLLDQLRLEQLKQEFCSYVCNE